MTIRTLTTEEASRVNLARTKPVWGGRGYVGNCPACGRRKRLLSQFDQYDWHSDLVLTWYLGCGCGSLVRVGITGRVEKVING